MFVRLGAALRLWVGAACAAVLLAACGGGGGEGGGDQLAPGRPVLQGDWELTATVGADTSPPVVVPANSVPSSSDVASLSTASLAELTGRTRFQGYTVDVTGNVIRVTDPDTNYTLTINSLSTSGYQGCDTCAVGTAVSFNVSMNVTAQGTLDGLVVAPDPTTIAVTFRFRRIA